MTRIKLSFIIIFTILLLFSLILLYLYSLGVIVPVDVEVFTHTSAILSLCSGMALAILVAVINDITF